MKNTLNLRLTLNKQLNKLGGHTMGSKTRQEAANIHLNMADKQLHLAFNFFEGYKARKVMADHKRAMDSLNRAYEQIADVCHQVMLSEMPKVEDRDQEWRDLYYALPHNLFQINNKNTQLLYHGGYEEFTSIFLWLNDIRINWRDSK